ncbi:MAG: GNAT family N-acetyltransferase [Clostridia bacterium]|nr:GNAT family N-acetyltransferase [Clostridia bacterium]
MLKAVEKNDAGFLRFCDRDVFGTRIKAYYNCYSTDYDFIKFWAQYDDEGKITAAISRIDGDATLCADSADYEEIAEFMNIVGYRTIQCEKSAAEKLTDETFDWGYVVRCEKAENFCEAELKKVFELKEIYDIIKPENLTGVGDYLPWLSDTTFRVNRNTAEGRIAVCDSQNAGCAMVLFRTDKAALLGAVATKPQFRGRGLARSLVLGLAKNELENGRRVELLCKNGSIVEFYKSIGFCVVNEWGLIKNAAEFL